MHFQVNLVLGLLNLKFEFKSESAKIPDKSGWAKTKPENLIT